MSTCSNPSRKSENISNQTDNPVYYIKRDDGWFYEYNPVEGNLYNSSFTIDTINNKIVDDESNG